MPASQQTRVCSNCGLQKPLDAFYTPPRQCKTCICAKTQAYKAARKPLVLAQAAAYRQRNSEAVRASQRRAYAKHKDRVLARNRDWRSKNGDRYKAYQKQYKIENRDRVIDACHRRRARKLSNGPVEDIDRRTVYARDGGHCWICERPVDYEKMHLDHVIPLAKGGTHTYLNVKTACAGCNLRKNAKMPEEVK